MRSSSAKSPPTPDDAGPDAPGTLEPPPPSHPRRRPALGLVALLSATFAGAYYSNVALVPLQAMLEHFHKNVGMGALVLGGFAVPLAAATPIAAHAGDSVGLTRALSLALGVLALTSAAAALAPSFAVLVAVRVLQGMAAAIILPGVMILLSSNFSERERPLALGMWSSVNSLGRVVAVPVGGLLAAAAGWSAVFWSAVPFFALAAVAVALAVPRRPPGRRPVEGWTAASLTGGAALLLGGLSALAAGRGGVLAGAPAAAAGAALLVLAWRRSRARGGRLLPAELFSSPTLLRSTIGAFVQMATIMVDVTGVALFLVRDEKVSSATAGLVALAFPAAMVVVSTGAGAAMARVGGRRVLWAGLGILAVAQAGIALALEPGRGISALVVVSLGVAGAGAALVQTAGAAGATRPEHPDATSAVGVYNLVRFSGTALGAAWLAMALTFGASYPALFASVGGVVAGAFVLTASIGRGVSLRVRSP